MKIRKQYTLYINPMTAQAFYGGSKFDARISRATFGTIIDCNLSQLKNNLNLLAKQGFGVVCMKH